MNIKQQIFGPEQREEMSEDDIITIHDAMMAEYGWVPLDDFKRIPIPMMLNLLDKAKTRHEMQAKAMNKKGRR